MMLYLNVFDFMIYIYIYIFCDWTEFATKSVVAVKPETVEAVRSTGAITYGVFEEKIQSPAVRDYFET